MYEKIKFKVKGFWQLLKVSRKKVKEKVFIGWKINLQKELLESILYLKVCIYLYLKKVVKSW